ncbi:MAG: hypothetical protein H7338_01690 [Candidatus Sericytochromatia bacterium]|nr:hypothetical protein [Candidatus Sericytochromatia bacterium]
MITRHTALGLALVLATACTPSLSPLTSAGTEPAPTADAAGPSAQSPEVRPHLVIDGQSVTIRPTLKATFATDKQGDVSLYVATYDLGEPGDGKSYTATLKLYSGRPFTEPDLTAVDLRYGVLQVSRQSPNNQVSRQAVLTGPALENVTLTREQGRLTVSLQSTSTFFGTTLSTALNVSGLPDS